MSQALKRKMARDRNSAAADAARGQDSAVALADIRAEAKANAEVIGAAWASAANASWLPKSEPAGAEPAEWFG